ncbi:MAG: protein-L-isoaspartate(D-aspartate) O-methyltransferase [bacterium]
MLAVQSCQAQRADKSAGFDQARERMVRTQIESRGISDSLVLAAMRKVERHRFVPERQRASAYTDQPLPIGEGQTISQPYIVALMTALLELDGDEKVLEIGTGSGYQAAVLGELAEAVFTIEIVEPLAGRAETLLTELGYENITVRCGDGYIGWSEQAPFDAIIITCAPPQVPQPLIDQLADGGRMVVPVGRRWQELILIEKHGQKLKETSIIPVRFVPMTGDSISSGR